jgi:hypothetical protein
MRMLGVQCMLGPHKTNTHERDGATWFRGMNTLKQGKRCGCVWTIISSWFFSVFNSFLFVSHRAFADLTMNKLIYTPARNEILGKFGIVRAEAAAACLLLHAAAASVLVRRDGDFLCCLRWPIANGPQHWRSTTLAHFSARLWIKGRHFENYARCLRALQHLATLRDVKETTQKQW